MQEARPTPSTQIANGSRGLLDEVATGKVTGEEEYWSHTDLWDFQANVDGARVAWEGSSRSSRRRTPIWPTSSTAQFDELQALLDKHREGDGFVTYDKLDRSRSRTSPTRSTRSPSRCRKLAAAVRTGTSRRPPGLSRRGLIGGGVALAGHRAGA